MLNSIFKYLIPYKCSICSDLSYNPICKECTVVLLDKIPVKPNIAIIDNTVIKYVFDYSNEIRKIMKDIKYRKRLELIDLIVVNVLRKMELLLSEYDLIAHIPVSQKRFINRGFDQAEKIASHLNKDIVISNLLRHKDTVPLYKLNRTQRKKEVKDAFILENPLIVKDKTVLLVDDIVSSGSTISSACNLLKEAGAQKIDCFALAYKSI